MSAEPANMHKDPIQKVSSKKDDDQELLGKLGNLIIRLARSEEEISLAQQIRYQVFHESSENLPEIQQPKSKLDIDRHDDHYSHFLILMGLEDGSQQVIGTQRVCLKRDGDGRPELYSQSEYDVAALIRKHPGKVFMDLGRSCILPDFRHKRTMELLWQGTWAYAVENKVEIMIGCASFHSQSYKKVESSLQFLHSYSPAEGLWAVKAIAHRGIQIQSSSELLENARSIIRQLPPLIKGYLRLGAMFSSEAVVDLQFETVDIFVVLPIERINPRYLNFYGKDASRHRG
ncbi:MAG: GNAT family N-acyltransferase [Pseudomonadota bacterium]